MVLIRMTSPSLSTHVWTTWGDPSGRRVAKLAKDLPSMSFFTESGRGSNARKGASFLVNLSRAPSSLELQSRPSAIAGCTSPRWQPMGNPNAIVDRLPILQLLFVFLSLFFAHWLSTSLTTTPRLPGFRSKSSSSSWAILRTVVALTLVRSPSPRPSLFRHPVHPLAVPRKSDCWSEWLRDSTFCCRWAWSRREHRCLPQGLC